jgi:hypothetical protein
MKRALSIVCLFVFADAPAAHAQSPVYVGGDLFLDLQRVSGQTAPTDTTGATVGGGGVRLGAFLASRWTLEIGVDASAATDATDTFGQDGLEGGVIAFGLSSVSSVGFASDVVSPIDISHSRHIRTRVTATSVLLGYHPPPRGRLTAGFKGGISVLRSGASITSTTIYTLNDPRFAPFVSLPAPTVITSSYVIFDIAATIGAEAAIALTRRAAIVPEVRVMGIADRIFLRPGAELRWLF